MIVGFAAEYSKVRDIWDCTIPELQRSFPLIRTGGSAVIYLHSSLNCLLPEAKAKASMVKHAGAFFHNRTVKTLGSPILLWRIRHRKHMLNSRFLKNAL